MPTRWYLQKAQCSEEEPSLVSPLLTVRKVLLNLSPESASLVGSSINPQISPLTEDSTGRVYALKRMRKSAVVQCPEHVYCEQAITKNVAHPFCIRQYASFQVDQIIKLIYYH